MKKLLCCSFLFITSLYGKYGYEIKTIEVPGFKKFSYAQWLYPQTWDLENYYTSELLQNIAKVIKPGMFVIDIGAHTGDTSVAYALAAGETGKVIAFECSPPAYEILKVNALLHPNIIADQRAITEEDGVFIFHYNDLEFQNGGFGAALTGYSDGLNGKVELKVQGINLEKYLNQNFNSELHKIGFIKIDTEGYDHYILRSLSSFVKKYSPIIQCEILCNFLTLEEKIDYWNIIKSLGYTCYLRNIEYTLTDDMLQPLDFTSFINLPGLAKDLLCFPNNFN